MDTRYTLSRMIGIPGTSVIPLLNDMITGKTSSPMASIISRTILIDKKRREKSIYM